MIYGQGFVEAVRILSALYHTGKYKISLTAVHYSRYQCSDYQGRLRNENYLLLF
jgi:hypothetical protein